MAGAVCGQTVQPLDHTRRGRAAIDQIAGKISVVRARPRAAFVASIAVSRRLKLVVAAMDIAHRHRRVRHRGSQGWERPPRGAP